MKTVSSPTLKKNKGVRPNTPYPAIVVDNNDPSKLQRVRARIPGLFDHIPDDKLPWALPSTNHKQGLNGGQHLFRHASFCVPRREAKVALYFPTGNPMIPQYSTQVPTTVQDIIPEAEVNYPDRMVEKLDNGTTLIFDTRTNECFVNLPGDAHLTFLGDAFLNVLGNLQATVTGDKGKLPSYIAQAPDMVIKDLNADAKKRAKWLGLFGDKGAGSAHFDIQNDLTMKVGGEFKADIGKNFDIYAKQKTKLESGGRGSWRASRIDLN